MPRISGLLEREGVSTCCVTYDALYKYFRIPLGMVLRETCGSACEQRENAEGVSEQSPGSAKRHPGKNMSLQIPTLKGLHRIWNPFRVRMKERPLSQGGASLTLGCDREPRCGSLGISLMRLRVIFNCSDPDEACAI
jgi:hypothetical protein